jgi:polyisoprenoid-binding protein YceI
MKIIPISCIAVLVTAALAMSVRAEPEVYEIDPVHSTVVFKVRHFFTEVPGRFNEFSGTITVDPENLEGLSTETTIKAASIDTDNEDRDKHLRSADFFDVEKYPEIVFKSKGVESTGDKTGKLTGELTMHGVTREIELEAKLLGKGKGMQGETKTGWKATTTINRRNFDLNWGKMIEGTAIVGDEVGIELNIEANLK